MFQLTQIKPLAFLPALFVLLMFLGCGTNDNIVTPEARTTPGEYTSAEEVISIIKKNADNTPQPSILLAPGTGDWSNSALIDDANGGEITLDVTGVRGGVVFKVLPGALVADTTISMHMFLEVVNVGSVDKLGTLCIEFGPSGTQFNPHAHIIIPFELLLNEDVNTLDIIVDSGGIIEDISYDIDWENELIIAYAPHFSEYYFPRP